MWSKQGGLLQYVVYSLIRGTANKKVGTEVMIHTMHAIRAILSTYTGGGGYSHVPSLVHSPADTLDMSHIFFLLVAAAE